MDGTNNGSPPPIPIPGVAKAPCQEGEKVKNCILLKSGGGLKHYVFIFYHVNVERYRKQYCCPWPIWARGGGTRTESSTASALIYEDA